MGRKRKSEGASDSNPPKRVLVINAQEQQLWRGDGYSEHETDLIHPLQPAIDPYTGEPRKRGRPRKYPPGEEPQPPPGPKRGRGRPRKDGTIKSPDSAPATPQGPKRPVGRPRKTPVKDDAETPSQPTESDAADTKSTDDDSERTYWLMKAEPESRIEKGTDVKFSIDDLEAATEPEPWDARNHMRAMKKGDYAFFYHSNCKVPGIVGIMEIVQEHTPDESAFDPAHPYYDAKSNRDDPKWDVVHVEFRRKFDKMVTLNDLKAHAKSGQALENLQVLKQSRLSVSSVTPEEWKYILGLAGETLK
ncbi:putative AT DNA binding protein (Thy28) [Aspergillus clavatus NRRL 1]|uniref:Thymocyte nuclear protein 1 n=1 Tax=Aspergillus clavatus (strain ATCC 1007 / CBS 513.65 / DSM 816 / NCTC 3887 / NRRL 1 / QM 1276 / 107) TaxID=344612 RepID=A1CHH2_ASPCL|nr:AT DNA binding protein (Thy28), putative [Aspergillus clavatus NRRL 1]EAW10327.1 AT DNA binding protein (Thy28), putative [Aspergillus clavatus NRRL 1]